MDTSTCVDALVGMRVARFGVPSTLTSDKGRQFSSALWASMCRLLGVQHITTSAYHSQSNCVCMVERTHRQLKGALYCICTRLAGAHWPEHLPWVLLGPVCSP